MDKSKVDMSKATVSFMDLRFPQNLERVFDLCENYVKDGVRINPNAASMSSADYAELLEKHTAALESGGVLPIFPPFYQPGLMELFHNSGIDCLVRSYKGTEKPEGWPEGVKWDKGQAIQKLNRLCHRKDLRKMVYDSNKHLVTAMDHTYILGPQNISPYTKKGLIRDAWQVAFEIGFENRAKKGFVNLDCLVGGLNNRADIMSVACLGDGYYFANSNQFVVNWGFLKDNNGTILTHDELRKRSTVATSFSCIKDMDSYRSDHISKDELIKRLSVRIGRELTKKDAENVWYNISVTCLRQTVTSFWSYGLPNLQVMMPLVAKYVIDPLTGKTVREIEIHLGVRDITEHQKTASQASEDTKVEAAVEKIEGPEEPETEPVYEYTEGDEVDRIGVVEEDEEPLEDLTDLLLEE